MAKARVKNVKSSPPRKSFTKLVSVSVSVAMIILLIVFFQPYPEEPPEALEASQALKVQPAKIDFTTASRPIATSTDGYTGSEKCQSCHQHEHETWYNSYHRTMTQVASSQSIVGNFSNQVLTRGNQIYRLGTDGQHHWVEVENLSSKAAEGLRARDKHPIVLCTGSHHMQVYWMLSGRGRELIDLPFVWLIDDQRWIPRESSFLMAPLPPNAEPFSAWNASCMACHTTHPNRALNELSSPQSTVAEFGISCEACHGPGQAHVDYHQLANKSAAKRVDPMVDPSRIAHDRSAEVCGQCHMAWHHEEPGAEVAMLPGDVLAKSRHVVESPYQFWPDGMVRIVGRELNGLQASQCYKQGELSCISCHEMHPAKDDPRPIDEWNEDQLKANLRGDQGCVQCHTEYSDEAKLVSHTHHSASSEGSRCYNCHMPNTTFGLLKATMSHQITNPSVKETLKAGRPNACNLCHLDKTIQWTEAAMTKWYGTQATDPSEMKSSVAMSATMAVQGNAAQRALIAWHMGWEPARRASKDDWIVPYLTILMNDEYPAVRYIANRSLKNIGGYEDIPYHSEMSPSERQIAIDKILGKWRTQVVPQEKPEVMMSSRIGWDETAVQELLKRRDNTPVFLHE